jgi:hypothetical protein
MTGCRFVRRPPLFRCWAGLAAIEEPGQTEHHQTVGSSSITSPPRFQGNGDVESSRW